MDVWRSFVVESGACYHVISWGWPGRNNSCTFRVGPWWEPRMVHMSWSAVHTSGSTLSYIGWFPLKNQSESHLIEWFKCGADPLVSLHPIWCLFVLTHTFGGITYLKPIWCAFVITCVCHNTHIWEVTDRLMNTLRHFAIHLCPYYLLMEMLNHWKHFAAFCHPPLSTFFTQIVVNTFWFA